MKDNFVKINCELPFDLLEQNNELNDIDFILFHLYDQYPMYRTWFMFNSNLNERTVLFDNSAYEYFIKGEQLDTDAFAEAIRMINPTYYILPDVLMDYQKTVSGVDEFLNKYTDLPGCPMAVVQGNSPNEILGCALMYSARQIHAIALPFHNSFFKELGKSAHQSIKNIFLTYYPEITDDMLYAMGRVEFVREYKEILEYFDYVHMLGSHCPLEKVFYNGIADSMDTGYPVKLGYENIKLFEEHNKPSTIIDDFICKHLSDQQISTIQHNIMTFKEL